MKERRGKTIVSTCPVPKIASTCPVPINFLRPVSTYLLPKTSLYLSLPTRFCYSTLPTPLSIPPSTYPILPPLSFMYPFFFCSDMTRHLPCLRPGCITAPLPQRGWMLATQAPRLGASAEGCIP